LLATSKEQNGHLKKQKREQAPALLNGVIYNGEYITVWGKVKKKFCNFRKNSGKRIPAREATWD